MLDLREYFCWLFSSLEQCLTTFTLCPFLPYTISRSFQLLDEDEEVAEELAISKWNTDSVEEFLDTVMVKNEDAEIDISENLI